MSRQRQSMIRVFMIIVVVIGMMAGWMNALAGEATPPGGMATEVPTQVPVDLPTETPAEVPTDVPTQVPPELPTEMPTEPPTEAPTELPQGEPTETPTEVPATEIAEDGSGTPEVSLESFALLVGDGILVVTATDASTGGTVFDACFALFVNDGGARGEFVSESCDFFDEESDGQTTIDALAAGEYILVASWVEPGSGYLLGGDRVVAVAATGTTNVTFPLARGGRDVQARTVAAGSGATVVGACFEVYEDLGGGEYGNWMAFNCDDLSNAEGDGVTEFPGLPTGRNYILSQVGAPAGHALANDVLFTLVAGSGPQTVLVTQVPVTAPGNLVINKRNESNQPLPGACFAVFVDLGGGVRGDWLLDRCDEDDGDADGQLAITGLASGLYVLVEFHAPDGYINGYRTTFAISSTQATVLTVPNILGGSNISIQTVDSETDELIFDACYALHLDSGGGTPAEDGFIVWHCDDWDGSIDGITPFTGLAAGDYVLEQVEVREGYHLNSSYIPFSADGTAGSTMTVENVALSETELLVQRLIAVLVAILQDILNGV